MRIPDLSLSRERRQGPAIVVVMAILSTTDLTRMPADTLCGIGLLELTAGMLLAGAMILAQGLRERTRGVEPDFL